MATSNQLRKDDPLRARDAQTVISPGVRVGPANDDRIEREPAAVESAPSSYRYGMGLTALAALALIVAGVLVFFFKI